VSQRETIVIFGASGATGHELVAQGLSQGRSVTAFVRNPARLSAESRDLHVVQADVTNVATVERAIEGQDAVLCALGAATPLRRDNSLVEGVRHITDAMSRFGARRLVYLSFLGVRDGRTQLSFIARTVVARSCCTMWSPITRSRSESFTTAGWTGSSCVHRG
jgi:uncharacterized protein YbjT (DUF2867 family)